MATVDPFTKGAGTSGGSGGAIKQGFNPPVLGPYDQQTGQGRGGYGPIGGRTNPQHTLPDGRYNGFTPQTPRAPRKVTSPSDKSQGVE